jgi:hypothetical protein
MPFFDIILIPLFRAAARSGGEPAFAVKTFLPILIELPPHAATPIDFSHLHVPIDNKIGSTDRIRRKSAGRRPIAPSAHVTQPIVNELNARLALPWRRPENSGAGGSPGGEAPRQNRSICS